MRNLLIIGLLAATAALGGGCQTPAYSPTERSAFIQRTWKVDSRQIVDDWDSILLLRPPSRLTIWHIR